jgi:hypothetical protein
MDNGVLLETKTLVELIRHYTSGTRCAYFPYFTPAIVTYEVRKFPAIFIVVVLKIQMVFGSYLKRN